MNDLHSPQTVADAFAAHPTGGHLKPICNRRMYGNKCRCWVRYVILDGVHYWQVHYLVNQREVTDPDHLPLLDSMRHLVRVAARLSADGGRSVVINDPWHNRPSGGAALRWLG